MTALGPPLLSPAVLISITSGHGPESVTSQDVGSSDKKVQTPTLKLKKKAVANINLNVLATNCLLLVENLLRILLFLFLFLN